MSEATAKPKVAFFDFSGCEGDQLQVVNLEEQLLELVQVVDVVSFREASSAHSDDYEIAFVEGSATTPHDAERMETIRDNADLVVALGEVLSEFRRDDAASTVGGVAGNADLHGEGSAWQCGDHGLACRQLASPTEVADAGGPSGGAGDPVRNEAGRTLSGGERTRPSCSTTRSCYFPPLGCDHSYTLRF